MTMLTWESKKHRSVIRKSEKVGISSLWQDKGNRCVHLPAPRAISIPTWSYSEAPGYKGQPKNSSAMTHPNDHISIASQKGKPRMISGALRRKRSENISKGSRALIWHWATGAHRDTHRAATNKCHCSDRAEGHTVTGIVPANQTLVGEYLSLQRSTVTIYSQEIALSFAAVCKGENYSCFHPASGNMKAPNQGPHLMLPGLARYPVENCADPLKWSILCSHRSVGSQTARH